MVKLILYEYDRAWGKFLSSVLQGFVKADPFLGQIRARYSRHRCHTRNVIQEKCLDLSGETSGFSMILDAEEVRNGNVETHTLSLHSAAESHCNNMFKLFSRTFGLVTDATGNSFDMGGKRLEHDDLIDLFERTELSFDADGEPVAKTVLLPPKVFDRLAASPPTASQEERMAGIIARKKAEWLTNRRIRRLGREVA